ncbi:MAG: sulfatase [Acidobacteria bacterium]|nr:sulfatase [Acidobacteriota bacterium]MDA1235967.1 sulfatase [Acidobacteriota bacterium]
MMIRPLLTIFLLLLCAGCSQEPRLPNVVVIFIDDMGYADIGPFGASHPTPNLDRMALEGRRFTDFQTSSPVCSASRAALLTGALNKRIDVNGAYGPYSEEGLNPDETTLAELVKTKGYATAVYGKWHLGDQPKFLPANQGFDEYYGLPYSNDMWPQHGEYVDLPPELDARKKRWPNLPIIEGTKIVDDDVTGAEQALLTRQYTERAVSFIDRNKDNPFFLYVPHTMMHVPIFASDRFLGKSGAGLYADVVMEIDWSVGEIIEALRRNGLDHDTLVVFTTDNGPWLNYGNHAGSAKPFREGKHTIFEGGNRVPTIFWWPGRIPADTSSDYLASTIDILPTVAALIGADLPDKVIDGSDIRPLLFGEDAASPHEYFPLYHSGGLKAIRTERWKLTFPHTYNALKEAPGMDGAPGGYVATEAELELYDLDADPSETSDVKDEHPEIVADLVAAGERYRTELGDRLTGAEGSAVRPAGQMQEGDERLNW